MPVAPRVVRQLVEHLQHQDVVDGPDLGDAFGSDGGAGGDHVPTFIASLDVFASCGSVSRIIRSSSLTAESRRRAMDGFKASPAAAQAAAPAAARAAARAASRAASQAAARAASQAAAQAASQAAAQAASR